MTSGNRDTWLVVAASAVWFACSPGSQPSQHTITAGNAVLGAGSPAAGSGVAGRSPTAPQPGGQAAPIMPQRPNTGASGMAAIGGNPAPPSTNMIDPTKPPPPAAGMFGPVPAGSVAPPPAVDSTEPKIPEPKAECQAFKTGDMTFAGSRVKIWAGEKKSKTGPVMIYWYATGGSVAEVNQGVPAASIKEITDAGGIIAAMYRTTSKGMNTGNGVWYTGDYDVTDEVIACAAKIHDVDTHHIHALGWSAGGLQSGYMAYFRSSYMASVAPYSGGSLSMMLQDPSSVPSAMLFHGAPGADVVILDFSQSSDRMGADLKMKGGFALNCNHMGGHMIPGPPGPAAAQLFFKAHGFKTKPSPWASMIPAGVPSYCKAY